MVSEILNTNKTFKAIQILKVKIIVSIHVNCLNTNPKELTLKFLDDSIANTLFIDIGNTIEI